MSLSKLLPLILLAACAGKPSAPKIPVSPTPIDVEDPPPTDPPEDPPIIGLAITLCWDLNPEPNVVNYGVYVDRVFRKQVTTNRATIDQLEPGRVYGFHITARDSDGLESDFSQEVRYVIPVMSINNLALFFQVPVRETWANQRYHLESTTDLNEPRIWVEEDYHQIGESGMRFHGAEQMKFFRVRIEILRIGCAA